MQRKHQREFEGIIDGQENGSGVKVVDIIATPGAGKSSIPIQATRLIKAGLADAILWVVPRSALQNQGERGFYDPFFREMFHHNSLIRASTNDVNPCRGTNGFVTTYQAIAVDKLKTVLNEVRSKRYIIILDEPHHLEKEGIWHTAIDPIVQAGHFLIKMTGTLGRGDKKEIAYIDYKKKRPYFKNCDESRLIIYSRIDALKEKAILPIEFHLSDGKFEWERANGDVKNINSFGRAFTPTEKSEALFTALNSEFASQLLMDCVIHWRIIKKKNPLSKLLIVTADYKQAKDVLFMLQRSIGVAAEIATSHESPEAFKAIKRFKTNKCDCLVTIAMAYEGLDVPSITHICNLTNIRSREWIEQMLARGVRIDRICGLLYGMQRCYVFAPADSRFKKVVDMIRKQQIAAIEYFAKVKEDKEDDEQDDEIEEEPAEPVKRQEIIPLFSQVTDRDKFLMGIDDNDRIIPDHSYEQEIKTVKEQEIGLRKKIKKHVNKFCFDNRYRHSKINHEIKKARGKNRDLMTLPELESLMKYVLKHYPINGSIETIKDIPGLSLPRGKSKRVSNKVEPWTGRSEILKQSCYDPIRHLLK